MTGLLTLLFLLLLSDAVSDFLFSLHLLAEDEAGWGGGLMATLLVPAVLLPLYALVSRSTRIKQNVTLADLLAVSPYIHSAPASIIQLAILWSGLEVPSVYWRWCQFLSLGLSLATLSLASFILQEEPGPRTRKLSSGVTILTGCLLRTVLISLIFKCDAGASSVFLAAGYLLHLGHHLLAGDGRHSIFLALCNLFIPTGQTHQMCPSSEQLPSNSEIVRAKLNDMGLCQRLRRFLAVSFIYNTALTVFYFVILELRPAVSVIELLTMRSFTIPVPLVLLATSQVSTLLYYQQVRRAAESQSGLTPPKSPSSPMRPESGDVERGLGDVGRLYPVLPSAPSLPVLEGNKRCDNLQCVTCTKLLEGPVFTSSSTGRQYTIGPSVSCTSEALIYLITCRKCLKQYVGKSSQSLRQRHYGHRREIETESSALGQHFSQANCGPDSLTIQIIELVRPVENLLVREGFWQHELASFAPLGINIRDELGGKLKT